MQLDPISLEILWSRLIAIVDEASVTLVRTSFSSVVRDSNDFACVLLDSTGRSLAQSTLSIPSFIGTLPLTVRHLLRYFPADCLRPGDVVISNDPWLGTGQHNDINILVPVFQQDRLIALAASTAHAPDIGGRLIAIENREVYEEGLCIPVLKLFDAGRPNQIIFDFITQNVRVPDQVVGDVLAQVAADQLMGRRLVEMMAEYKLTDLGPLVHAISDRSEVATRAAIRELPAGQYHQRLIAEGIGEGLELVLTLTVDHKEGRIVCDYTGTCPQVQAACNVVPNYAYSYTAFAVKCVVAPYIPNNDGCFAPITVTAPEGSLLNPRFPAACASRHAIGHHLPALVFGALAEAVPQRVRAAAGSPNWATVLSGEHDNGSRFAGLFFQNGGMGGARGQDGLSCMCFPSNASNTPVEVLEQLFPIRFLRRALLPDSAGPGQWRGGFAQVVEFELTCSSPAALSLWTSHTKYPAAALAGGKPGSLGAALVNGEPIDPTRQRITQQGDRVTLIVPGGGGFGRPDQREPAALERDVEDGLVTPGALASHYGRELQEALA